MTARLTKAKLLPFLSGRAILRPQNSSRLGCASPVKVIYGTSENGLANTILSDARSIRHSTTMGKKTDPVFQQMISAENRTIAIRQVQFRKHHSDSMYDYMYMYIWFGMGFIYS